MKIKSILKLVILSMSFLAFVSCSSDSTTGVATGYFIDSAVAGVDYKTPTQSGVTDADGAYKYKAGESVVFSIGNVTLGNTTGGKLITPLHLCHSDDESDPKVVNMLVFLQSLDDDGDASNGIHIKKEHKDAAGKLEHIHFQEQLSDSNLTDFMKNDMHVDSTHIVDNATAKAHFVDGAMKEHKQEIEAHKQDVQRHREEAQSKQNGAHNSDQDA